MTIETEAGLIRCCGPEGCGVYGNPDEQGVAQRYCEGRGCMGWRWLWIPETKISRGAHLIESTTEGFCGLAGKPSRQP